VKSRPACAALSFALALAVALGAALTVAAAPSEARAEDWHMDLYEQAMLGVGGAPRGGRGLDSRGTIGAALGFRFTADDGHGFGLTLDFLGDLKGEQTPGLFHFLTDLTYVHRARFLEHERFTFALGVSVGVSDASYDSRCPTDCTPEEDAVGAVFNVHDSAVAGGVMALGIDHPFEDDEEDLYVGIELVTHVLAATEDEISPVRWNVSAGLRFGGRFEM
jgi:hypothetical protein